MTTDAGERDVFKEHVATYERFGDHLETLQWKKPGSSMYAIWFVRQHGALMVFGDCYEAVYMWNWQPGFDMRWIAGCNLDYFVGKCRASYHGAAARVWDSHLAQKNMNAYFREFEDEKYNAGYEEEREQREQREKEEEYYHVYGGRHALGTKFEWDMWLNEHGYTAFGDDFYESVVVAPGNTLDPSVKLHLEGLKAAMKQLEEKEKHEKAS